MAWRAVEDEEEVLIGVSLRDFQEHLKTPVIHPGQLHTETLPAPRGFDRRVEVCPFVSAFDDIRWTETKRAVAPPMPVYEAEARLVEGQDL